MLFGRNQAAQEIFASLANDGLTAIEVRKLNGARTARARDGRVSAGFLPPVDRHTGRADGVSPSRIAGHDAVEAARGADVVGVEREI